MDERRRKKGIPIVGFMALPEFKYESYIIDCFANERWSSPLEEDVRFSSWESRILPRMLLIITSVHLITGYIIS